MANRWTDILTEPELDAAYALTASLDRSFAGRQRAFYESRTAAQLSALAQRAWNCSDADGYQMAHSYAAKMEG